MSPSDPSIAVSFLQPSYFLKMCENDYQELLEMYLGHPKIPRC